MAIVSFFDIALLATLPGRTIEPAAICVQPHEDKRKPFTVGLVRVRTRPGVDAVVHEACPDYRVLWPGKPTMNTVWTAVEDGCATGIACTPAPHLQSKRGAEG